MSGNKGNSAAIDCIEGWEKRGENIMKIERRKVICPCVDSWLKFNQPEE
jgi:hypothetical protein